MALVIAIFINAAREIDRRSAAASTLANSSGGMAKLIWGPPQKTEKSYGKAWRAFLANEGF